MTLDELVSQLKLAYGASLRSVVLYGSAVAGEHIAKKSDYNVLVVVDAMTVENLRKAAAVATAWSGDGNPPPMTFTTAEWKSSSDIFPMEYADILERHRVLFGEVPFEGISVAKDELRLQVEHEAMGKLLQLRQGVMAAGGDAKNQLALLEDSLSTLMVIFRGVARLNGETAPQDYEALATSVAARAGFAADPFVRVVRHVRGAEKLRREEAVPILEAYLAGMERLVAYLDSLAR
ncbi:MAG: hypothetical protein H0W63_03145 [Gemmatimonadaceae bacterium]|nr:hypothetical protein [Gemmatimonadaceae bacterium]